jgi:hypothetical protein
MRVPEEPVCIDLFRQNPVFTSLHLKSPVHVHRLRKGMKRTVSQEKNIQIGAERTGSTRMTCKKEAESKQGERHEEQVN